MNGAFYIGAVGLTAEERGLDVVANNVTNINTTGFKRSEVTFSSLVTSGSGPDAPLVGPAGGAPLGVVAGATPIDFSEGPLQQTGKPLDVAIDGAGFLELMAPGGQSLLWRGGSLEVNTDGYLAAPNGMPLKGMIAVPQGASAISIGPDGKVQALVNGSTTATTIGQIDIVMDKDLTTLSAVNGGFYQAENAADLTSVAPGEDGAGSIAAGELEGANVQLADEMTTMLLLERAYGANAQVVQAGDQLMSIANNLRR